MNTSSEIGIAALLRAFESAWAARDAIRLGTLFTADADYIDFAGDLLYGRAAIIKAHAQVFAGPLAQTEFSFTSSQEAAINNGVVLGHARWELTGQRRPDGSTVAPRHGIITFVLLRPAGDAEAAQGLVIRAGQNTESLASPFGQSD